MMPCTSTARIAPTPHAVLEEICSVTRSLRFAGGHIVIATWCQREESPDRPFTPKDKAALQFLYDEWAHPYFVSVQEYGRLLEVSLRPQCLQSCSWGCFAAASASDAVL